MAVKDTDYIVIFDYYFFIDSLADALSSELTEAEAEIERQVFARVYDSAIFPNGDANIETDM